MTEENNKKTSGLHTIYPSQFGLPDNFAKNREDFTPAALNKENFNHLLDYLESINKASDKFAEGFKENDIIAYIKVFLSEIHQAGFPLEEKAQKGFLNFVRKNKKWMIIPAAIMGIGGSTGYTYESAAKLVGEFAHDNPDIAKVLSGGITAAAYSGLFVYKTLEARFHTQHTPLSGVKKSLLKKMEESGLPGVFEKASETLKQKIKMVGLAALSGIEATAAIGHGIEALAHNNESEFWVAMARTAAFATVLGPMAGQTYNRNFRDSEYFKPSNKFERLAKRVGDFLYKKLDKKDPRISGILIPAVTGTLLAGPAAALLAQGIQEGQPVKIYSSIAMITTYLFSISYLALGEVKKDKKMFMDDRQFSRLAKAVYDYNHPIIIERVKTYNGIIEIDNELKGAIEYVVDNNPKFTKHSEKEKEGYMRNLRQDIKKDSLQELINNITGDIEVMAAEIKRLPFVDKSLPFIENAFATLIKNEFPEIGTEVERHFAKLLNTKERRLVDTGDPDQESVRIIGANEAVLKPGKRKIEFGKDKIGLWFQNKKNMPVMTKAAREIFNTAVEEYNNDTLWSKNFPFNEKDFTWAQKIERGLARNLRCRSKIEEEELNSGEVIWKMGKDDAISLAELVERITPFGKPENIPPHVTQVFMESILSNRMRKTPRREEISIFQG